MTKIIICSTDRELTLKEGNAAFYRGIAFLSGKAKAKAKVEPVEVGTYQEFALCPKGEDLPISLFSDDCVDNKINAIAASVDSLGAQLDMIGARMDRFTSYLQHKRRGRESEQMALILLVMILLVVMLIHVITSVMSKRCSFSLLDSTFWSQDRSKHAVLFR